MSVLAPRVGGWKGGFPRRHRQSEVNRGVYKAKDSHSISGQAVSRETPSLRESSMGRNVCSVCRNENEIAMRHV